MYCGNCGSKTKDSDMFCAVCGYKLKSNPGGNQQTKSLKEDFPVGKNNVKSHTGPQSSKTPPGSASEMKPNSSNQYPPSQAPSTGSFRKEYTPASSPKETYEGPKASHNFLYDEDQEKEQTDPDWLPDPSEWPKDPYMAIFGSLFIPGFAFFYTEDHVKGLLFFLIAVPLVVLFGLSTLGYIGIAAWIIQVLNTYTLTKEYAVDFLRSNSERLYTS